MAACSKFTEKFNNKKTPNTTRAFVLSSTYTDTNGCESAVQSFGSSGGEQ